MTASGDRSRFESKVDRSGGPDACHEWKAARGSNGYGQFRFGGKTELAHRVAFLFSKGRWPDPCACHHCDNRACVNEAHLFEGTQGQNILDMCAKGRHGRAGPERGERHFGAKVTDAHVELMRAEYATGLVTHQQLADRYGLTRPAVTHIINGKRRGESRAQSSV